MKDHVIVCGAGTTGGYIIDELVASHTRTLAIDRDKAALAELAARHPADLFDGMLGDATDDELLAKAGLAAARGIVAALPDDKDNIYITVEAKAVNPAVRVIAKAAERSHIDKMRRVGADGIVTPPYIGGMRMVSEMLRPAVVRFLDEMLRDTRSTFRIDEATIEAGSEFEGLTLAQAGVRQRFQMSVLAVGTRDRPWVYNPDANERLAAGTVIVVLGTVEQLVKLREAAKPR